MWLRVLMMAGLVATGMGANDDGCAQDGDGPDRAATELGADGDVATAGETGNVGVIPAEVATDLAYLREEEKLARDVYDFLGAKWGLPIFGNIASSERTHTARVATRMAELGLPDPVVDDTGGAFVDTSLAELYAALTARGAASLEAALQVGATIEDLDIQDIALKRTRTDDPATLAVYDDLMCGSRNHLRAFVGQLTSRGAAYSAQYLSQAEVDAIVLSAKERCGGG